MMGTKKLNRHFVGTALVSVLLSLLLALTPVLAVAEPANGGRRFRGCGGGPTGRR